MEDFDWTRKLSGHIADREGLMRKPRAIVGYLSEKDWALIELLCFIHASWLYVTSLAQHADRRIDLFIFADRRWLREAASICEAVNLQTVHADDYRQIRSKGNKSTCFVVPYQRPPDSIWHGYPFLASFHFLADDRVGALLRSNYGYAIKTDLDCFITATLIQHFPQQFETGYMFYTPLPGTSERLQRIAGDLGFRHRGRHDISPTWYADVDAVIAVANASIPVLYHLLDEEFPHNPDGSWRTNWASGEGWPLWSKDIAAMYAPDLVLNHLFEHFDISKKYDVHGDTEQYTFTLYHIHLQHGDGNFSKFEFFRHKYADRDITTGLDFNLVKDYALWLAVSTWRHLAGVTGDAASALRGARDEL